mgnify:FL=1
MEFEKVPLNIQNDVKIYKGPDGMFRVKGVPTPFKTIKEAQNYALSVGEKYIVR